MANAWVALMLLLPSAAALGLAVGWRCVPPRTTQRSLLAATGLATLSATVLLVTRGGELTLAITWIPRAGPMGVSLGTSGLYALAATFWGAFLVLGATAQEEPLSALPAAGMLLALSAGGVALLADHFLARYVALEIVAFCVPAVLLVAERGHVRTAPAWSSYLILRLGDAGLLAAILLLMAASGTLSIDASLSAASGLEATHLGWVVAGFMLAAWVKVGAWPFYGWALSGSHLPLACRAWLYATLLPNLGVYLLYRTAPLVALALPIRATLAWLGAGSAVISMVMALYARESRAGLVHLGATQGAIAILAAASGLKGVAWLCLLVLTPLRLLLFLAADTMERAHALWQRRAAAVCFVLGGIIMGAFDLVAIWWMRGVGLGQGPSLLAEAAAVLAGVWTLWVAYLFAVGAFAVPDRRGVGWSRWLVLGLMGAGTLAAGAMARTLLVHLAVALGSPLPSLPTPENLLAEPLPARLPGAALAVILAAIWLRCRPQTTVMEPPSSTMKVPILEQALTTVARALHAAVEGGLLERALLLLVRGVLGVAAFIYRHLETGLLESGLSGLARTVGQVAAFGHHRLETELLDRSVSALGRTISQAATFGYRYLENGLLDGVGSDLERGKEGRERLGASASEGESCRGFLGLVTQSVFGLGRGLQRWHTGRLRLNLLWALISLTLIALAAVWLGGRP